MTVAHQCCGRFKVRDLVKLAELWSGGPFSRKVGFDSVCWDADQRPKVEARGAHLVPSC